MIDPIALESAPRPYDPNYRVYVRDEATLERLGEVDEFASFDTVLRFNEPATWVLDLPRNKPIATLLDLGSGIIVMRSDQVIMSGPVRAVRDDVTPDGTVREVSGIDDTGLLADRLALPVPTGPPYTDAEYDTITGTAEDAARYFVERNAGPTATEVRRIPGLIQGTYQAIGRPISFRSGKATGWYQTTTVNAQRPKGAVEGDTILIVLEGGIDDLVFTPPDNKWTKLMGTAYSTHTAEVWWKRLGRREPSTYRWRINKACDGRCGLSAFSGVHPTDVTDGFAFAVDTDTSDPETPSITTVTPNTQIVTFFAKTEKRSLTPPAGFSQRYDEDNIFGADAPKDATGPTGVKIAQSHNVNTDDYACFIIALRADNTTATDQISAQGRFDNLLELTQSIAVQGGNLRFEVRQVGTERAFAVDRISDLSADIIFSQELGTLISASSEREGPLGNYIYAGGGGEGTSREFVERGDTTTLEEYWRAEVFVDKRSQTGAELGQAIDEAIEEGGPHVGYTLEPVDTDVIRFGRDYDLGDTVTAVIDGTAYAATVREARLHIDANGALVSPVLNPTGAIGASRGFSPGRLSQRMGNIERNAEGFTLGMGMLWSREPEFIPSGWGLCDGTLGTVDMRGRFPIGADPTNAAGRGDFNLGEVGGTSTVTVSAHKHGTPNHTHLMRNHFHDYTHDHLMANHTHEYTHNHTGFNSDASSSTQTIFTGASSSVSANTTGHVHNVNLPALTDTTAASSPNDTSGPNPSNDTGVPNDNTTTSQDVNDTDFNVDEDINILPPYAAWHFIQRIAS